MKILASNYRCCAGEVDLIALDPSTRKELEAETIVFVEVKTRTSDKYVDPQSAVDSEKRRRIRKVADYYLSRHQAEDLAVRFDVVAVVLDGARASKITHIPQAF